MAMTEAQVERQQSLTAALEGLHQAVTDEDMGPDGFDTAVHAAEYVLGGATYEVAIALAVGQADAYRARAGAALDESGVRLSALQAAVDVAVLPGGEWAVPTGPVGGDRAVAPGA